MQIQKLFSEGYPPHQIAEMVGMELSDVESIINKLPKTIEEQIEAAKPAALKTIIDIAAFGDSEVARLKAAQIILEQKTRGPASEDRWGDYLTKMKKVMAAHDDALLLPPIEA
jgi:hypothetical protein